MGKPGIHEALIHLMVVVSTSDHDMTDVEKQRIDEVVDSWPVFEDYRARDLPAVTTSCRKMLGTQQGLQDVFTLARTVIPKRLHDTAYALAVEIAAADMEMHLEERSVLRLIRENLAIDDATATAIERATKARHRTLT